MLLWNDKRCRLSLELLLTMSITDLSAVDCPDSPSSKLRWCGSDGGSASGVGVYLAAHSQCKRIGTLPSHVMRPGVGAAFLNRLHRKSLLDAADLHPKIVLKTYLQCLFPRWCCRWPRVVAFDRACPKSCRPFGCRSILFCPYRKLRMPSGALDNS